MRSIAPTCLILLLLPFLGACSSTPEAGKSKYNGMTGILTGVEKTPYQTMVVATKESLWALGASPMELDSDGFRTTYIGDLTFGALSESHDLKVWITRLDDATTKIEFRIVGWRAEDRLQAILDDIRKRIASGKTGQSGIPTR